MMNQSDVIEIIKQKREMYMTRFLGHNIDSIIQVDSISEFTTSNGVSCLMVHYTRFDNALGIFLEHSYKYERLITEFAYLVPFSLDL